MSNLGVSIENLDFSYKGQSHLFFSNLNLQIETGESFGLFGPNGAGKTTLMHLMTGILTSEKGGIKLLGKEIRRHDKTVNKFFGYVPQDFSFYQELSPVENLEFFGAWSGMQKDQIRNRTAELLEILGLDGSKDKITKTFSGGMKRRLNLAIGVMSEPEILFLDEPTVGVDVQTRHAIIDYLKLLNNKGTTLVYTSHQLNEAEDLCKKIALIDEGKIIAHEYLSQLLATYGEEGLEGLFISLTGRRYRD